jgi:cytochrome c553
MKQKIAQRGLGPLCIGVLGTIWLLVPATRAEAADPAAPPTQAAQPAPPAEPSVNYCADCHEKEVLPISLGHSFHEWKGSTHGRAGVACEKCHGGDPSQSAPVAAHRGVLPATDPTRMVSPAGFSNMCGACHVMEYEAFLSTVHGVLTKDDEARATCQTCHGSMATSLPSPAELRSRCAVCLD